MSIVARIVHELRGRTRLRIKGVVEDAQYFEAVRVFLLSSSGVDDVRVNPLTGSVLVLHKGVTNEELRTRLGNVDLFEFSSQPEPQLSSLEHIRIGASALNRMVSQMTSGRGDLRTVAFVVIVSLAIRQIVRGQVLSPASALLWNAMDLVIRAGRDGRPD